ncbi:MULTISPECIES: hypothetical protein [Vibrio]|uniref:hypothetical protein n=1 Tax=Vibrio TaxID=662 RepID=UPI00078EA0AD|nr:MULTISPECIES: hypothetical protein [Vibrio]BAU70830.1 hypothetical protein [Vibrio sp. 04Ya108]BBM67601.1 hypothetical protein VA249_42470 [Vibrio alfacsensis]BCN27084.1 hypothetical protein VYA_42760 [Vibrio alfacsensis]
MLKDKISSLRESITNCLSDFKEKFDDQNLQSHISIWKKKLEGKVETGVFKPNRKVKGKKPAVEQIPEEEDQPIGLVTAERPESTPLHESTLRVSSRKYRNHIGIAQVMGKSLELSSEKEAGDD